MRRLPPRVLILAAPVWVAGLALAIAAAASYASTPHGFEEVTDDFAFLLASTLASRYPVPIEGAESGGVTLSFVFGAAGIVLFGWDAGVLIALAAPAIVQLLEHRPLERIAYNASVFALGAGAAGALLAFVPIGGTDWLVAQVAVSAATQYAI